jgi:transposase-like protein
VSRKKIVRRSVEEMLNALLEAEADRLCNAGRYERTEARRDMRAGSYERKLQTSGRYAHYVPGTREPDFATLLRICAVLAAMPNDLLLTDQPVGRKNCDG